MTKPLAIRELALPSGARAVLTWLACAATVIATYFVASAILPPQAESHPLQIAVQGNHLTNGVRTVRLVGVNRSGSEYACAAPVAGGGHGYGFFQGPVDDRSIRALLTWKVNAVALPLNEACWLGAIGNLNSAFSGEPYRQQIQGYVRRLNQAGIYVILRLSGAAPSDNAYGTNPDISPSEIPMADADHALDFWRSVAARFKANRAVLFHAFDEPNDVDWDCVQHGCQATDMPGGKERFGTYSATGHQQIVDAIRAEGARQPIIISGIQFAGDVSQWEQHRPRDPQNAIVVGFNSFDYSGNYTAAARADLTRLASRFPVLVGGFGDTNCTSRFSSQLMRFADSIHISYLAWTWNTVQDYGGCSNALLDGGDPSQPDRGYYTARPSGFGRGIRNHYRQLAKPDARR